MIIARRLSKGWARTQARTSKKGEVVILIFFKPLLTSLGVSWSNFTSLFSDRGLIEPRLGSLGLCREVSGLFLSRHWPPLSAFIRLSPPPSRDTASGKWRLMPLVASVRVGWRGQVQGK